MEKLKEILGLAPDAADEEVEAAVKGLKERADALEAQAKEAEAARFAAENSDKCDEEALKNAYLQSPEVAKALVANMKAPKAPEQPQTILNSKAAPAAPGSGLAACKSPEERIAYLTTHRN